MIAENKISYKYFGLLRFLPLILIPIATYWKFGFLNNIFYPDINGLGEPRVIINEILNIVLIFLAIFSFDLYMGIARDNTFKLFSIEKSVIAYFDKIRVIDVNKYIWSFILSLRWSLLISMSSFVVILASFSVSQVGEMDVLFSPNQFFGETGFLINLCYLFLAGMSFCSLFVKSYASENDVLLMNVILLAFGNTMFLGMLSSFTSLSSPNYISGINLTEDILNYSGLLFIAGLFILNLFIFKTEKIKKVFASFILPLAVIKISLVITILYICMNPLTSALNKNETVVNVEVNGHQLAYNPNLVFADGQGHEEFIIESYFGNQIINYWSIANASVGFAKGNEKYFIDFIASVTKHSNSVLIGNKEHFDTIDPNSLFMTDYMNYAFALLKYDITIFDVESKMMDMALSGDYQGYLDLYVDGYLNTKNIKQLKLSKIVNDKMTASIDVKAIAKIIIYSGKGVLDFDKIKSEEIRIEMKKVFDEERINYENNNVDSENIYLKAINKSMIWLTAKE